MSTYTVNPSSSPTLFIDDGNIFDEVADDVDIVDFDLNSCPCDNCKQCDNFRIKAGCHHGICICLHDERIETQNVFCNKTTVENHDFMQRWEYAPSSNNGTFYAMPCPMRCPCGCDDVREDCIEGLCYCKEGGMLVSPKIEIDRNLTMFSPRHPLRFHFESPCPTPTTPPTTSVNERSSFSTPSIAYATNIVLPTVFATISAMVLVTALRFACIKYRKRKRLQQEQCMAMGEIRINDVAIPLIENDVYAGENYLPPNKDILPLIDLSLILNESTLAYISEKSINPKSVKKLKEIGHGHFGKVYKGVLQPENGKEEQCDIAIKTPILSLTDRGRLEGELRDFYNEAKLTSDFSHKNILSCLGITKGPDGIPWLIFEFMPYGDLLEVLKSNCGLSALHKSNLPNLSKNDLWFLSFQIATGMCYLTNQRFTHRDLAARNCLIGTNLQLKISDFGLTRDVYTDEYYKMGEHRLVPVRWMAPESIERRVFSSESDVFSFGIVLWEIYTFGKTPYYGLDNHEVANMVPAGLRLSPPDGCPDLMQKVMISCWKTDPCERINFDMICYELSDYQDKSNQFSNPSYDPVVSEKKSEYLDVLPN